MRKRFVLTAPMLTALPLLTGCARCESAESARQKIAPDGTAIFVEVSHCSALNNSVRFYIDQPQTGRQLLGQVSDVEEFGQTFDARRHQITIWTSNVEETTLFVRRIGPFSIRKAAYR